MKGSKKAQKGPQEQLISWLRILTLSLRGGAIEKALDSKQALVAYHSSDGRTSREVAKSANTSRKTIIGYWKKWAKLGIVTPISVKGGGTRYQKTLELADFGPSFAEVAPALEDSQESRLYSDLWIAECKYRTCMTSSIAIQLAR